MTKAAEKADNKIGKFFEDKVMTPTLQKLEGSEKFFYHKLKDTYAAGTYLPKSPADYLVACNGQSMLMECKASVVHYSLKSCLASMVGDSQVAHHRLWQRTGNKSLFVFYSDQTANVEFWNGAYVVECRVNGSPLKEPPSAWCDKSLLGSTILSMFE